MLLAPCLYAPNQLVSCLFQAAIIMLFDCEFTCHSLLYILGRGYDRDTLPTQTISNLGHNTMMS